LSSGGLAAAISAIPDAREINRAQRPVIFMLFALRLQLWRPQRFRRLRLKTRV
jgi:hypothetical protein